MTVDPLVIAGRTFRSRLIVGTGKYASPAVMVQAHEASGAEMVTVAVRRVNLGDWRSRGAARGEGAPAPRQAQGALSGPKGASDALGGVQAPSPGFGGLGRSSKSEVQGSPPILEFIDTSRFFILPNTAGCYTAMDAIRTARLGREAGLSNWVKLEVIGDERTLFPDNEALLEATRVLVSEGFVVLPYTNDDPIACRKLQDAGAAAVMPLGAPIGSGLGIQNRNNIEIIREAITVPLIVDAGVGTASDAAVAMELGADGVLMNTAIAGAQDPVAMAEAMKLAVQAGRLAFLSGRIPRKRYATASSPIDGAIASTPTHAVGSKS